MQCKPFNFRSFFSFKTLQELSIFFCLSKLTTFYSFYYLCFASEKELWERNRSKIKLIIMLTSSVQNDDTDYNVYIISTNIIMITCTTDWIERNWFLRVSMNSSGFTKLFFLSPYSFFLLKKNEY